MSGVHTNSRVSNSFPKGCFSIRNMAYLFVAMSVITFVFLIFIRDPGLDDNPHARVSDMVYGKAHKPFVYRALLPSIVRIAVSTIPERVKSTINKRFGHRIPLGLRWPPKHTTEYLVASAFMWLSLILFNKFQIIKTPFLRR